MPREIDQSLPRLETWQPRQLTILMGMGIPYAVDRFPGLRRYLRVVFPFTPCAIPGVHHSCNGAHLLVEVYTCNKASDQFVSTGADTD